MPDPLTDLPVEGTTVVTAGRIGARQIEVHIARQRLADGSTAWLAPAVKTYREWAADTWHRFLDDGRRQLLGGSQVDALWRRVIEESAVGQQGLLGYRHASVWAREASRQLLDWNIDPRALQSFQDDPDCQSFIHWERAYRNALDASGWMDATDVEQELSAHVASLPTRCGSLAVWSDLAPTSAQELLWERLRDAGHRVAAWDSPPANQRCRRVQLPNTIDEVRTAAAWAADKLLRQPRQRVAIVVPGLEGRRGEIAGILEDSWNPECSGLGVDGARDEIVFLQGRPAILEDPVIGAAVTALELFTEAGDFQVLSRWLRSPFFSTASGEPGARSILETQLRSRISSQLGFLEAFHNGGLAARVHAALPALAETLGRAVQLMDSQPRRATPTHWTGVWRQLLNALGWYGGAVDSSTLEDWESALNEFACLTPILGSVSVIDALLELEGVLRRSRRLGAVPLNGVFVLTNPEDVGPGYDALWVCGLTDTQWPRAAQPSPLLPLALQRAHGIPSASPTAHLAHSRLTIRRLVEGIPDVVLSSPEVVHEHPVQPSPLILRFPVVSESDLIGGQSSRANPGTSGDGRMELLSDPVPPVRNREIRGGIRTLSIHSLCPLRAFIESRLHARPLEAVRPGLSARQRGTAAHMAVQRLYSELPGSRELASWTAAESRDRIDRCSRQALFRLFGSSQGCFQALFQLELARLQSMLAGLLEMDLARAPFQVVAVEKPVEVSVGGLRLSLRIDRIDQLGTGKVGTGKGDALAVIDYKTGSRHGPGDWLKERPRDLQLPLYASIVDGEVEAVAIAVLHTRNPCYRGFWAIRGEFPGRSARRPAEPTWAEQRKRWRGQLDQLAREFAKGDGRIFQRDLKAAGGAFAPLSRVHELEALARMSDS